MASLPPQSPQDGTRVDLGEDLLDARAPAEAPQGGGTSAVPPGVSDQLNSARILMSEGLLTEARKALFAVLRMEPHNPLAATMIEDLRKQEIQKLFHPDGGTSITKRRNMESDPNAVLRPADLVLEQLARDWRISIVPTDQELEQIRAWLHGLRLELASRTERKDWAVALVQADFPQIAAELLETVTLEDPELWCLRASVCILAQEHEAARSLCEQALRDSEFPASLRQEASYLLAQALAGLGAGQEAMGLYESLGSYRDSELRLRALTR